MFSSLQMSRMSVMKFLCALLVVAIHAKFTIDNHLAVICHNMVQEGVCRIAVPFFFFAAGYFISRHMLEPGWWWRELKKRVRSVLIPGVMFLLAYILITYALDLLRGGGNFDIFSDFGFDLYTTPLLGPTWFIRALIVIVGLSPVLFWLYGKRGMHSSAAYLLLLAIIVFLVRPYSGCGGSNLYYFFNYGLSLEGLLYFSAGIFVQYNPIPRPSKRASFAMLLIGLILFVLKFIIMHYGYHWYAFRVGFFAIPFTLVGLYFSLPNIKLPASLQNISFQVYLIHFFILSAIGGRCGASGDWTLFAYGGGIFLWCFRIAIAFAASILIANFIGRYFPRLNSMIFGGRNVTRNIARGA